MPRLGLSRQLRREQAVHLESQSELLAIAADRRVEARQLVDAIDAAPKTRRFKLRARVGERVRWYELPEESIVA